MKIFSRLILLVASVAILVSCSSPPAGDQDPASAAKVRAIFKRWIEVQGGRSELEKSRGIETEVVMTVSPGNGSFRLHNWQSVTGRYRYEIVLPKVGVAVEAYDGKVGWRQNEAMGFGYIPPADLAATLRHIKSHNALNAEKMFPRRRLLADEQVGGRPCNVVEMTAADGLVEKWYFEVTSGLVVREEKIELPGRQKASVVDLADIRKVGKYPLAYTITRREGEQTNTFHIQSVVLNPVLSPSLFAPPASAVRDAQTIAGILERHLAAIGGARAFSQVQSRVTRSRIEVPAAGVKSQITLSQKRPNLMVSDQMMPGIGRTVQGYDGTTAWVNSDLQGYRTLKGPELQQALASANLQIDAEIAERYPLKKFHGEKTVAGRRTYAIGLATMQGVAGVNYFDVENARLLRTETNVAAGPNSTFKATVDFSDFRVVDGIVMPFFTTLDNPAMRMTITVESVENNVPLDDAIFKPRKAM